MNARDYYVGYNATTIDWVFYSYFKTYLRYIILGKDINVAPLIRTPNSSWSFAGNQVYSVTRLYAYFHYHAANTLGWAGGTQQRYVMGASHNLDHFDWAKEHIVSINLSLTGGYKTERGESTLNYFKSAKVNTDGALSMINDYINSLDLGGNDKRMFKAKIGSIYKHYHDSSEHPDKSVLQQYLIKKNVIDEFIYISTPYGYPIPILPSVYLHYMQLGDSEMLKKLLRDAYKFPDWKFAFDPVSTKKHMRRFRMHRGELSGVQGRITGCNEELFTNLGNVLINTSSNSGFELSGKLSKLFMTIAEMLATCNQDPNCRSQVAYDYPVVAASVCAIM
jgi:hypothetical protein